MIPAVDFLATEGVAKESCIPYLEHTDTCSFECKGEKGKSEKFEKYYCKPGTLRIESEVESIQRDIYENGPVMAGLVVWEDLYNYDGGVYEHTTGDLVGGHAMRIVGWGHNKDDNGHLYWIA